ncbi:MAG: DUF3341 domain-containing protein [Chloroflexi bacterium]|nr:DUF3341 domain-containing protein [Chloroflexota bacterium]
MAQMLGLFKEEEAEAAANATEALERAGYSNEHFEVLTGSPYPEGAFGEREVKHKLYVFPFMGALLGLSVALLLTSATQMAYPLIVGGKPILSMPAMTIIAYEGTMLGAILFTVMGIFFESRLPNPSPGIYDPRITAGYIGITLTVSDDRVNAVDQLFRRAGAADVVIQR